MATRDEVSIHCRILAAGYPHDEHVCFWMWSERRPRCPQNGILALRSYCTKSEFGYVGCCYELITGECLPQRLQSVCVLLWRLPKDEVPFAMEVMPVSS